MRLKSVRVREFRSIVDSGEFQIDDTTCLVGKNESGKTAVLEALYRLNPVIDSDANFDVTHDYPRTVVADYQHRVETEECEPATAVTAVYELSDDDVAEAEEQFGAGFLADRWAKMWRGYENKTSFEINLNESVAVRHLLTQVDLPDDVRAEAGQASTLKKLLEILIAAAENQEKAYQNVLDSAKQLQTSSERARAIDEANGLRESASAKQLRTQIPSYLKTNLKKHIWRTYLDHRVPKFLYFDEYYQMEGQLNIPRLQQRQSHNSLTESDHPMLGLIELARLNIDQLISANNTQDLVSKLEGASNYLSKQILRFWSQNKHIHIRFDLRAGLPGDPEGMQTGMNLWGFVYDTRHMVMTPLGTRSRGFVWFFSFLAWFSQQRKRNIPLILLLDEPGLFLHANAQDDLLRYIEQELKPHHQVIYTTHSPFMVDSNNFSQVRIVRDKSMESDDDLPPDQQGTKVFADVLKADQDSLFPLQSALGYDIAQTLFIGPNCLIVEGVSDLIYLSSITDILAKNKRVELSDSWTITPVGGSNRVTTFVSLLRSQKKINVATLIDFQKRDQQTIENLYKAKLLARKNVHTFAKYTGTSEADIEDMFEPQLYLDIVNAEYDNELVNPIELRDLGRHPRILVNVKSWLELNPLRTGTFNHYRPARYFAENIVHLGPKLNNSTLDCFEEVFKKLNTLL